MEQPEAAKVVECWEIPAWNSSMNRVNLRRNEDLTVDSECDLAALCSGLGHAWVCARCTGKLKNIENTDESSLGWGIQMEPVL